MNMLGAPKYTVNSGSLGVVGDVSEVMAQVDRRLTKVNSDDLIITVNDTDENLGRHNNEIQTKV
jgi:hypothetical protein